MAGYSGEPYARVGPAGVFVNDNSPATYLNADRYSTAPVPAGVNPAGPPRWRQVSGDPVFRWHDHRVHWMLTTLPPQVAASPGAEHRISSWTVVLSYGGQRLTATGTLDWVPGPSPWPWFVLVLAAALGVALLRSRPRLLGVVAAVMVACDVLHGLGVMLVTSGTVPERLGALFGADALLIWPFGVLAAVLLWRRAGRAVWLAAAVGAVIAATIAVDDAPDLWRSSSPTRWPLDLNRALVALVLGTGLGLILAAVAARLLAARSRSSQLSASWGVVALPNPQHADSCDDLEASDAAVAAGPPTGRRRPADAGRAGVGTGRGRAAARWPACSRPAPSARSPARPGDWPSAAAGGPTPEPDRGCPTSVPVPSRSSAKRRAGS